MLEANRVIYVTLYSSDLRRRSDLQTTSTAWLLNRAGRAGEHIICVRTDEANRPDDQQQNDGQHHGVFGDVLSRIVRPQLTNQLVHSLSSRPLPVPPLGGTGFKSTHDACGLSTLSIAGLENFHRKLTALKGIWFPQGLRVGLCGPGMLNQRLRGIQRVAQDPIGKDAEINRGDHTDGECDPQSSRDARDGDFFARLAHVHHDDHSEVVVRAYGAVDDTDRSEPNQVRLQGGTEHVKLCEEAASYRNSDQGQQKNG